MKFLYQKKQDGYIALMSVIIISLILIGLTSILSYGGYFTRASAANSEYKRISLGLAESCVNAALLKIGQKFDYSPAPGGDVVPIGDQTCIIMSVGSGTNKTIITKASFQGAFSTMSITATVQDPSVVYTPPTTLTVYANPAPGDSLPSEFHIKVDGNEVNPGAANIFSSGSHVVSETHNGDYTVMFGGNCDASGNIVLVAGKSHACSIYYKEQENTATLTVVANIFPSGGVSNLQIKNNSTGDIQNGTSPSMVAQVPANVSYTISATTPTGYQASTWSGACNPDTGVTGSLAAGTNYTCVINFSQPAPACADTVMILDRTGSMNSTDLTNERIAAKGLLNLYSPLSPPPQVGVGRFGDNTDGGIEAEVQTIGQLTNTYGTDSTTSTDTGFKSPSANVNNNWGNPGNAYSSDNNRAMADSSSDVVQYYNFGLSIPSGSIIKGIEVQVEGYRTSSSNPRQAVIDLSWNGGSNYTSGTGDKTTNMPGTAPANEAVRTFGGPSDIWNRTWSSSDFANFRLRLDATSASGYLFVDHIQVKVYYTISATGLYRAVELAAGLDSPPNSSVNTNVADAISVGNNELNSSRHQLDKAKVLILISDGDPNEPGSNGDASREAALDAADGAKLNNIEIFTIHFGTDPSGFAGQELLAALANGSVVAPSHSGHSGPIHQTGSADDKSSAAAENSDNDNFYISPTSADMAQIFTDIGKKVCPAAAGVTQAKMNVVTQVINSNGGVGQPGDFHITISGAGASPNSFDGSESGTEVIVSPDTSFNIDVATSLTNYYAPQYIGCSATNNSVAAGETIYCTIVNYDKPPDSTYIPPPPPPANIMIDTWVEKP